MFLFMAIIEMINEGVLTDDLDAQQHIQEVESFMDDLILDESFGIEIESN